MANEPREERDGRDEGPMGRSGSASAGCWAGRRSCRSRAGHRSTAACSASSSSTIGHRPAARRCSPGRSATSSSGATSCPTTCRSSAGSTIWSSSCSPSTCSSTACRTTCSTRSSTRWASTARAFSADVARIRRFTPGPLRRHVRRGPELVRTSGIRWSNNEVGPTGPRLDQQGGLHRVKVILTKDVDKLGKSGEMKTVADGYATNFLIPHKLAVPAVRRRLSRVPARHRQPRGQAQARARGSRDRGDPHRVDDAHDGRQGRRGRQALRLDQRPGHRRGPRRGAASPSTATRSTSSEPIKSLGTYKVAIKVFSGMTPEVTIVVEPKG